MTKLSIRINIAGRTYPLNIAREEEEAIRKVAKDIDDNIKKLQESYAVKDKQDLLAMTALQYGTELATKSGQAGESANIEILQELSQYIDEVNRG